jgi:hypothetical protein
MGAAGEGIEGGAQSLKVELVDPLRLAEGGLELLGVENRGEVDESAGERRDRDPFPLGDVVGLQRGGAVEVDAAWAPAARLGRHRDLRPVRWRPLPDLPQGGRA